MKPLPLEPNGSSVHWPEEIVYDDWGVAVFERSRFPVWLVCWWFSVAHDETFVAQLHPNTLTPMHVAAAVEYYLMNRDEVAVLIALSLNADDRAPQDIQTYINQSRYGTDRRK